MALLSLLVLTRSKVVGLGTGCVGDICTVFMILGGDAM